MLRYEAWYTSFWHFCFRERSSSLTQNGQNAIRVFKRVCFGMPRPCVVGRVEFAV